MDERRRAVLRGLGGRAPMPLAEARALIAQLPELDTTLLVADRAEAVAELAAARRALGLPEAPPRRPPPPEPPRPTPQFDPTPLREAAQAVVEAGRRMEAVGASPDGRGRSDPAALAVTDQAVANAEEAQDQLAQAWRRTVGALISGTGMAIVIAAVGWPPWWYLIPIVLIAIVTADLRVAGSVAQGASVQARQQLTALGIAGLEDLQRVRERAKDQEAVDRLTEEARQQQEAAAARWSELAPGEDPADVEKVVSRRTAAVAAAMAPAAGEADGVTAAIVVEDDLPDTTDDPVLALALRLAREAQNTIMLIDDQLAAAARLEHARRSLEWHELHADPEVGARSETSGAG